MLVLVEVGGSISSTGVSLPNGSPFIPTTATRSSPHHSSTPPTSDPANTLPDDDNLPPKLSTDWRSFRASLVAAERNQTASPNWAYATSGLLERGAVILGAVGGSTSIGFGLRQQYFQKSVMLILDHTPRFTKGIILNRPTAHVLPPEMGSFDCWFGGDVQSFSSSNTEYVCIHSLTSITASRVSLNIVPGISWTSIPNALALIETGEARKEDFWVFAGYAGWGQDQLAGEISRRAWYTVAADSQLLLGELARQAATADFRDAGLETWANLMEVVGQTKLVAATHNEFADLMLKEWSKQKLLGAEAVPLVTAQTTQEILKSSSQIDLLLSRANLASRGELIGPGSLVTASANQQSPHLLSHQYFHHSLVLILADDEVATVGCLLNRPSPHTMSLRVNGSTVHKPILFGGEFAVKNNEPSPSLLWLFTSKKLRDAGLGKKLGSTNNSPIMKAHPQEALKALQDGVAVPSDFIIVRGITVWTKGEKGTARGIQGEIDAGRFDVCKTGK